MTSPEPVEPSPGLMRRMENVWEGWGGSPPSRGQTFRVDREVAEPILAELAIAIRAVADIQRELNPIHFTPPANDDVSINLNRQTWAMINDASLYLAEWRKFLSVTHDTVKRQLDSYVQVDRLVNPKA